MRLCCLVNPIVGMFYYPECNYCHEHFGPQGPCLACADSHYKDDNCIKRVPSEEQENFHEMENV